MFPRTWRKQLWEVTMELSLWLPLPCPTLHPIWLERKIQSSLPYWALRLSFLDERWGETYSRWRLQRLLLVLISNEMEPGYFFCSKQAACYNVQETVMFRAFPAQVTWLLYFSCSCTPRLRLTLSSKSLLSSIHVLSSEREKMGWERDLILGPEFLYTNL